MVFNEFFAIGVISYENRMNLRRTGALILTATALTQLPSRVYGQAAGAGLFDVASVRLLQTNGRPVPGCCSDAPSRSGERISWIATAGLMVQYAYNVPPWRVSGN